MIIHSKISDFKNITFFNGLNALRFIAALLVVLHHSETIKRKNGIESFEWLGLFRNGGNAVTFFFVLSGFLITYLLLKESGKTGTIKIKHFYLKRILRIWPLYFLLVILGLFGLPFIFQILNVAYISPYTFDQSWYYFVFFLPGLVTFYFGHHFLEPLWSIGVEEVFYLFWAPLFKLNKNRIFNLLIGVIVIKVLLSVAGLFFISNELFNYIINIFQFEAMAIGGIGAYFIYYKGVSLTHLVIFKVPFQIIFISLLIIYLIFHINIDNLAWNSIFKTPILSPIIIEILFIYLIICVSVIENSILKLGSKKLSFLGEISYGIYMYHMLIIFTSILFLKKYLLEMNIFFSTCLFYSVILILTIVVSTLSKYLFENFFLNFKSKLSNSTNKEVVI